MRDYQIKQNVGGVPDSDLATKDGANEYNSLRSENKQAVSRAGLILTPQDGTSEDTTQLSQSMMINGAGASSFQAAGTVDAITLTPVTGISGLKLPPDYSSLHGFRVGFYPIGTNTGNVTISIGQDAGSQFSAKKALNEDGTELPAATLGDAIYAEFIYDETADTSNGAFILIPYSLASGGGGVIATKVDKDLSDDVDYVPKVTLDGTETIYLDDNGTPKKALVSNISSGDALKVDKNLSNDTTYPPTAVIADDDLFFLEKNGATPGKISGLNLKAQSGGVVTLLETRTTTGTWTITSLVIGKPFYVGGDFRNVTVNSVREVRFRVESGSILGASPITGTNSEWEINSTDGTNPTTPSFVLIPTATSVVIEVGTMDTDTALVALQ